MKEFICDQCGTETNDDFTHPSLVGQLCFSCYEKASREEEERVGVAWIVERLPKMHLFIQKFGDEHGLPSAATSLIGNCHPAARLLYDVMKDLGGEMKIKRGHWIGEDCRHHSPMNQHSWTSLCVPESGLVFYLDPTQWVFTNEEPHIAIVHEDDPRYDVASHKIRSYLRGPPKLPKRIKKDLVPNTLSPAARMVLTKRFGARDWRYWTREECFEIANANTNLFDGYVSEVFNSLIACDLKVLIPRESYEEVFCGGHHP